MTWRVSAACTAIVLLPAAGCYQPAAPPPQAVAGTGRDASLSHLSTPVSTAVQELKSEAVVELAIALREDEDPRARREAAFALADTGSAADAGFIGQALTDADPEVRRAAVQALMGTQPGASVGYLALALNDPDARVRLDATEALGNIGSREARAALQQAALDTDPRVQSAAEQLLAEPERSPR